MPCQFELPAPLAAFTFEDPADFQARSVRTGTTNVADSGVSVAVTLNVYDEIDVLIENFVGQDARNAISAWWSWVRNGNAFGFALDSSKTTQTTLTAAAFSGDTYLTVDGVGSIVAGDVLRLRTADRLTDELVTVQSVAGSNVYVSEFWNEYPVGSTVTHFGYYPSLFLEDPQYPVRDNPFLTWTLRFTAREYMP